VPSEQGDGKAISVPTPEAGRTIFRKRGHCPNLRAGAVLGGDGAVCEAVAACGADVATGDARHQIWWEARVMPSFFIRLRRVLG
jgi:hypothetical protein